MQTIDSKSLRPAPVKGDLIGPSVGTIGVFRNQFVWYVTNDALYVYEFGHRAPNLIPPPIYITRFQVNTRDQDLRSRLQFAHDQNHCLIEFVGISFTAEKAMRYQWRLLGVETDWHAPTPQQAVTFAGLRPGHYTFEVQAINAEGVMSTSPARLSFTILPPFWRRWWFLTVSTLVGVGIVLLIFRQRLAAVRKEKRAQQEFSKRLIALQESERKRIAAELHDSLGQNLLIIRTGLQQFINSLRGQRASTDDLKELSEIALQSINEVREIAYDLHPHQLDRLGLKRAIQSVIHKFSQSSPIRFSSELDEIDGLFPKDVEINVYRIIQEGINNVVKHAAASETWVSVSKTKDSLTIVIKDNGKGFDPEIYRAAPSASEGFGLTSISERVRLLKGKFSAHSAPGQGTTLDIQIPIRQESN